MPQGENNKSIHERFDLSDEMPQAAKEKKFSTEDEEDVLEGIAVEERLAIGLRTKLPRQAREYFPPPKKDKKQQSLAKPIVDVAYQKQLPHALQDRVIINPDYQRKLDALNDQNDRAPLAVIDPDYGMAIEKRFPKVAIDAAYHEAIRQESPEDYLPELSSDLLEEIYENESTPEETKIAENFTRTVAELTTAFDETKNDLYTQKIAILTRSKEKISKQDQIELAHIDQKMTKLERHHERELMRVEQSFTGKMFELAEPVGVDPHRYTEAVRRYEKARTSIEDDYEGDIAEACAEFGKLYAIVLKNKSGELEMLRSAMQALKHRIDVALPQHRDERLKEAEKIFNDTIAPTPFERDLNDLTVAFEKKTQKIEIEKSKFLTEKKSFQKFPETVQWYDSRIKALQREADHIAREYVAAVDRLKREQAKKERSRPVAAEKKVIRETMPAQEAAVRHLDDLEKIGKRAFSDSGSEIFELVAESAGPEEIAYEKELVTAQKKLEERVFVQSDLEPYAQKRSDAIRVFDQALGRIENDFAEKNRRAQQEFATLFTQKMKQGFENNPDAKRINDRLSTLRYQLDVELPRAYSLDVKQAEAAYRRDLVVTEFDQELLVLTVAFEKKSLYLVDQKKMINDMIAREQSFADRALLKLELKDLDEQLREVAATYAKKVEAAKQLREKEEAIIKIMKQPEKTSVDISSNQVAQQSKKAA